MKKAKVTFSLKDQLFNPEKVAYLADLFAQVEPSFPQTKFVDVVIASFPELELKQRIAHITSCLHDALSLAYESLAYESLAYESLAYEEAVGVIVRALPPALDPSKTDDDFGDFIIAPLSHYVAVYGCKEEHLQLSLNALAEITQRFSAEDAIRYFINAFPARTLDFLANCATSENYHVRRLASEGTRPKLPWSQKLTIDHSAPLPILEALFADRTRYVTRSVANHLNDIAKFEPDLVIRTLRRWQASGEQSEKEMKFILKHALRTLVKQGSSEALGLLGFGETPDVTISQFATTTPIVKVGEALQFSLLIESHKVQNLMIDYVMHFAGDGKAGGQKVFKLKQLEMQAGQRSQIKKKHPLKLMTTRRLYEGAHAITLQVNGVSYQSLTFELVASS